MKHVCVSLFALFLLLSCADAPQRLAGRYATLMPTEAPAEYHHLLASSTVHASLLLELGARDRVAGICDGDYVVDSALRAARFTDFGSSLSPDMERVLAAGVDALMLSSIDGAGSGHFSSLGLPIVDCRDYQEPTPLARAEWACYYGRLVGQGERADSLFSSVEARYAALCQTVPPTTLLTDLPMGGTWYVPGADSYLARLYGDAGYSLPCSQEQVAGSIPLSIEQVLARGAEAEVWFIKYAAPVDWTYERLREEYPFVERIRAFRNRRIYGCNTLRVAYYEQVPFHPDLLLEDIVCQKCKYFSPLK